MKPYKIGSYIFLKASERYEKIKKVYRFRGLYTLEKKEGVYKKTDFINSKSVYKYKDKFFKNKKELVQFLKTSTNYYKVICSCNGHISYKKTESDSYVLLSNYKTFNRPTK